MPQSIDRSINQSINRSTMNQLMIRREPSSWLREYASDQEVGAPGKHVVYLSKSTYSNMIDQISLASITAGSPYAYNGFHPFYHPGQTRKTTSRLVSTLPVRKLVVVSVEHLCQRIILLSKLSSSSLFSAVQRDQMNSHHFKYTRVVDGGSNAATRLVRNAVGISRRIILHLPPCAALEQHFPPFHLPRSRFKPFYGRPKLRRARFGGRRCFS